MVGILRRVGRAFFYALMAVCFVATVMLGIAEAIDVVNNEPKIWGTYRETECVPAVRGCDSYGTWESDDGSIRKERVGLDGGVDEDGTARAAFQPHGLRSDDDLGMVHTAFWVDAAVWLPWVLAAWIAGVAVHYRREGRDRDVERAHEDASFDEDLDDLDDDDFGDDEDDTDDHR
ncbi:MAG: hypothetical protein QM708_07055 [Propioniciclava sp.]|uniref:hypothetical protein n=1 Tax=Propioniciclava sp. TaxID=2038686 RepID=UPI0039E6777B